MIIGIGCDIIKTLRIARLNENYGSLFRERIFTDYEIRNAEKLSEPQRNSYYAKRFAAKEAVAKAFGTGINADLKFTDIEVMNDHLGAPKVHCKNQNNLIIHLSLSDDDDIAIAYVIIEKQ